jgi:protein-arginine kinase activator protein McsA
MRKVHKHQEIRCPNCKRLVIANSRSILDCTNCVQTRMQSLLDPHEQRKQHQGPKPAASPIQPKTQAVSA